MEDGLEEGKAQILDDIMYAPGPSHANILQLCELIKALCWLMTIKLEFSHFWHVTQTAVSETRICFNVKPLFEKSYNTSFWKKLHSSYFLISTSCLVNLYLSERAPKVF